MRRSLIFGAIAFFLVAMVFGLRSARTGPPPLPVPNGYDKFLQAANLAKPAPKPDEPANAEPQPEALRLVREGLGMECRVPVQNTMQYMQSLLANLGQMKSLAHLLVAEARLAETSGRPNDAATEYLSVVRFGSEMSRGGLIIDRLTGMACEGLGLSGLAKLKEKLTPEHRQRIAERLEEIAAKTESPQETLRSERRWSRAVGGFGGAMVRLFRPGLLRASENKFLKKSETMEAQRRALIAELKAASGS